MVEFVVELSLNFLFDSYHKMWVKCFVVDLDMGMGMAFAVGTVRIEYDYQYFYYTAVDNELVLKWKLASKRLTNVLLIAMGVNEFDFYDEAWIMDVYVMFDFYKC